MMTKNLNRTKSPWLQVRPGAGGIAVFAIDLARCSPPTDDSNSVGEKNWEFRAT
jgi:hypothetical protein